MSSILLVLPMGRGRTTRRKNIWNVKNFNEVLMAFLKKTNLKNLKNLGRLSIQNSTDHHSNNTVQKKKRDMKIVKDDQFLLNHDSFL